MQLKILSTTTTNNFNDPKLEEKLKGLWSQNSKVIETTFDQGGKVFCVYHSYQGDYHNDYSVSLCTETTGQGHFNTLTLQWLEYTVDPKDELGILNSWKQVWKDEDNEKIKRKYVFDYEQYSANGKATIRIGV